MGASDKDIRVQIRNKAVRAAILSATPVSIKKRLLKHARRNRSANPNSQAEPTK